MLKRGNLEGPFSTPPDCGPLKSLPSYMVRKQLDVVITLNLEFLPRYILFVVVFRSNLPSGYILLF